MNNYPKFEKYEALESLGKGGFGSVYKVIYKYNNRIYAIKQISLKDATKKEKESIKKEANILSSIECENIVKYFGSFDDKESFNIIMEYCDGLDLRTFINSHKEKNELINEQLIYHFFKGICKGISIIHKIHRDLKPENIFLTSNYNIKIGDFGIAKRLNNANDFTNTLTGTILYMAPEIINREKYNNKVDIWALGCILYELCTLKICFEGNSILDISNKIKKENPKNINDKFYSKELQNLINLLLNKNYKNRPDINQIIKIIEKNEVNLIDKKTKVTKNLINTVNKAIINMLNHDEVFINYIIEKKYSK